MPNHSDGALVHAMSGSELSRVRTELQRRRILTSIPPHPPHRYFGNALLPTHRQVHIPTSPVWSDTDCRLGCLYQQETQQRVTLFADVTQSLLARTGLLARSHPHVRADLLAALKPHRSSDYQHISECRRLVKMAQLALPAFLGSVRGTGCHLRRSKSNHKAGPFAANAAFCRLIFCNCRYLN